MSLWGYTGGRKAKSIITFLSQPSDGDTVTIGSQTYTFKDPFVDSADNVDIGSDAETTRDNLIAAINAGAGAGSAYGTGTSANADVTGAADGTDKIDLEAKVVGTAKNSVATTSSNTDAVTMKASTLEEGIDPVEKKPEYLTPDQKNKVYATDKGWTLPVEFLVSARQTFEFASNPSNNDDIVIDSTTYTFKTTLTPADGEVLIGANTEETAANLVDAITDVVAARDVTFGDGASSPHPTVTAEKVGNEPKVVVFAKTPGSAGNAIGVSVATGSYGTWNKPLLQGGQDVKGSRAQQKITFTQNAGDTETVVVGSKTYTFQTTLTDSDGNVQIGADITESINNLVAAINLDAGAGTKYAASMSLNADVDAHKAFAEDAMLVKAKVFGQDANSVAVSTTVTGATWGDSTLKGGINDEEVLVAISDLSDELLAASITRIFVKDVPSDFRFDAGEVITIGVEFNERVVWTDSGADPTLVLDFEGNNPTQQGTATIKPGQAGKDVTVLEFDYTVGAAGSAAIGTFSIPNNNFVDGETITINTTVYTFKTALSGTTDGEILIGADAAETRDNIIDAINDVEANREVTFGYDTGTHSPHPDVTAVADGADVDITAKKTGVGPNSFDTLDTITDAGLVWGGATMSGGVDGINAAAGDLKMSSTGIVLGGGTVRDALADGTASTTDADNDFNNAGVDGTVDLQAAFDADEANLVTVNQ